MKIEIKERVLNEADWIIKTRKTIRELAEISNISKSTVHKDLHERLKKINEQKYEEVQKLMKQHIEIRHLRGGESTRQKYRLKK